MAPKSLGLVAKTSRQLAVDLAQQVVLWCAQRGHQITADIQLQGKLEGSGIRYALKEELTAVCDPIVVLGGDGTLISVCHNPGPSTTRILGVNVGTLGFLTEISPEEMLDTLEATMEGQVQLEERNLLQAQVSSQKKAFYAFNDVVLTKHAIARIFSTIVRVDGVFAAEVRGDGVIVSTPSGSTAYSLSAGGSIVHPGVDALLITPICPHSVASRPLVIPGSSEIELEVSPELEPADKVHFTVDGQAGMALSGGDTVRVITSGKKCLFVRSGSKSYYDVLGSKLHWSARSNRE